MDLDLDQIVRDGITLADEFTESLQDEVVIFPWIGTDDFGGNVYDEVNPNRQDAIIEEKEFRRKLQNGDEITQKAQVTIPRPVSGPDVAERRNPVDPRDKIVLPSGYTGPILDVAGLTDPITHEPYMLVIILG